MVIFFLKISISLHIINYKIIQSTLCLSNLFRGGAEVERLQLWIGRLLINILNDLSQQCTL